MIFSTSNPVKGQNLTITLNIFDIHALDKVSNHNMYSDKDSWKSISVEFINPLNNQKKLIPVPYNGELESVEKTFSFDINYEGDDAQFKRLVIYDKGNGFLTISRSEIPLSGDLDLTLTGGEPVEEEPETLPSPILTVTEIEGAVRMEWNAIEGATDYEVWFALNGDQPSQVDQLQSLTYDNYGALSYASGDVWSYYVVAKNDTLSSAPSNTATYTIP